MVVGVGVPGVSGVVGVVGQGSGVVVSGVAVTQVLFSDAVFVRARIV